MTIYFYSGRSLAKEAKDNKISISMQIVLSPAAYAQHIAFLFLFQEGSNFLNYTTETHYRWQEKVIYQHLICKVYADNILSPPLSK